MKRLFALIILVVFLLCGINAVAMSEDDVIRIIACSDFQRTSGDTDSNESCIGAVRDILSAMEADGLTRADGFFCCGDYDRGWGASAAGVRDLTECVSHVADDGIVLVQGNHDPAGTQGLSPSGSNDPASGEYGVYVIHEDEYPSFQQDEAAVRKIAGKLREYLLEKAEECYDRPIFVLSHLPLHYTMRTYYNGDCRYASYLLDAMNEGAERGLNILYLFGHNHSNFYDNYLGHGSIYLRPGDGINIATEWNAY
ncbi:MAG: metallophosphoesterase, partial [Clostridia bacterium]|nr:metallophosphoesterase [Clostridia bacterium]